MGFFRNLFGRWFIRRRPRPYDFSDAAGDPAAQRVRKLVARGRPGAAIEFDESSFPAFRASAIDRPTSDDSGLIQARLLLRDVFTPAQPVTDRRRFAGRLGVLSRLIQIIEDQRSHVVIYGERGIGKTSLVHILADVARESGYLVIYASCGAQSKFDEIFRAILAEVPQLYLRSVSPTAQESESGLTLADRLPPEGFDARELADICSQVVGTRVIIVLDEYDRIQDPRFRQSVAELIKNLSDRVARVQLILTGVASNLQELIGYIPSIRRNVIGLPMPRLSNDEARSLIAIGENVAGVRFDEQAIGMVALLANGSPYLVRLLSHHSSMKALDNGRLQVELADIWAALDQIIDEAEGRIVRRTRDQVQRLFVGDSRLILGGAARAASTPDGWFAVEDVLRHLPGGFDEGACKAELERFAGFGGLLEQDPDDSSPRFSFRDEALPTYLWMMIARDHLREHGLPESEVIFPQAESAAG